MEVILSHENADFDAVASLLAAQKLNPDALPILPERLNRNVAHFLTLYQNGLPFHRSDDVKIEAITGVTLVDTQRPPKTRNIPPATPTHIIDHHLFTGELEPHQTFEGESVGAATTLLVEKLQAQNTALSSLEATLLALGIYEDTGSLSYGTTTPRDQRAAAWLLEKGASLDTVRQFLTPPLGDEQQALFDLLFNASESRNVEGYIVTVCTATVDHYVSEISSVAHRLRDTLDAAVLFVLVAMPEHIQLVCRATVDALDVSEIARVFGGGGHSRAAAAAIHDQTMQDVVASLWTEVYRRIQPIARVADLMSYGLHTVEASQQIKDVVRRLRRIGHEGYPVVENGKIVGLLTRRDLDRAAEHGLDKAPIREIMSGGSVTLNPDDSILTLEQRMVESGWGQIPVVSNQGELIGIVTRTDLIKHWAQVHPPASQPMHILEAGQTEAVLGADVAALIDIIADHAQERDTPLYMVGGVVRDLLLKRHNLDLDFVVESSAIELAESLRALYGGRVSSFRPFGTAKWKLDETAASTLGLDLSELPDHIDFATARNEFYEHPTALPTVYDSSIKLDLGRRDFTINTIAIQLSPASANRRILDFYGGLHDLQAGLIRVLHSLSFVDDPTRILRAVRFGRRLNFHIEPRTAELIEAARPMLGRITGERLRNELTLLLRENYPEQSLRELEERGVLTAIHPSFQLDEHLETLFQAAHLFTPPWTTEPIEMTDLYWHLIAMGIPLHNLRAVLERLLFPQREMDSILSARGLVEKASFLADPASKPSQIVAQFQDVPELAMLAAWLAIPDIQARDNIVDLWTKWRNMRPITNGHKLRELGIPPGPCYSRILTRLRNAWLDGAVENTEQEAQLLRNLIDEGICDDSD